MATSYDRIPEFNHHVPNQRPHREHLPKHSSATEECPDRRLQAGEVWGQSGSLADVTAEAAQGHLT